MVDLRPCFGRLLLAKAMEDERVIALISDTGYNIIDGFKRNFPNRIFNLGICEQTLIGVASGIALEGYKVFVYGITPFIFERPLEQIKLDIDQQNVNVIIVGYADFPEDGPSHNPLDLKIYAQLFHNIKFYFPETEQELERDFEEAYNRNGPAFIKIRRL